MNEKATETSAEHVLSKADKSATSCQTLPMINPLALDSPPPH